VSVGTESDSAIARRIASPLDVDGFPAAADLSGATPVRFSSNWRGEKADPSRETEVRILWSADVLYLHFAARYQSITVFDDSDPDGRRDHLWDRDVAEAFLQPPGSALRNYKEFEISPNGQWIDLAIGPGEKHDLHSNLQRTASIDRDAKTWFGQLAIPMGSIAPSFDPLHEWRANFFRVEGAAEPRFYSAWRPTRTPQPNFHVPEAFGRLIFAAGR
jgi:alpha-galactosidase